MFLTLQMVCSNMLSFEICECIFIIDSIMVFNFDASICFEDSGYSTTGYPTPVYLGTPTTTSPKPTGTRTVTYYQ